MNINIFTVVHKIGHDGHVMTDVFTNADEKDEKIRRCIQAIEHEYGKATTDRLTTRCNTDGQMYWESGSFITTQSH